MKQDVAYLNEELGYRRQRGGMGGKTCCWDKAMP